MLASLDDINSFLPLDKLRATDGNPEITLFQVDADRIVKAYLSSAFAPVTLAAWADPATTPVLIRAVAGRLIAAFYYRKKLSEQTATHQEIAYPQRVYNEAMNMLLEIRSGNLILIEVDEEPGTAFDSSYFFPNATTDPPKFTMDLQF